MTGVESLSKREVMRLILSQEHCDDTCKFSDFCPRLTDAAMSEEKLCLIRVNYDSEFDKFFNLFFAGSEGLRNELRSSVYKIGQSSITPDEVLNYFNAVTKMSNTFYAPEKTGKSDEITSVNIVFSDKGEKKNVRKSRTKEKPSD